MAQAITLGDLFDSLDIVPQDGNAEHWALTEIRALSLDSRDLFPGSLFLAVSGAKIDSHDFIPEVAQNGAAAVLAEKGREDDPRLHGLPIPVFFTGDSRRVHAELACRFYQEPSREMTTFGVTGTNGKTSVSWLIANLLAGLNRPSALIGTLGSGLIGSQAGDTFKATDNTTPGPLVIQQLLAENRQKGAKAAVLEATSQGMVQSRTRGVDWDCAVFTNLTRDHLDLHGSLEEYAAAKLELFVTELAGSRKAKRSAVFNLDDPYGVRFAEQLLREHPEINVLNFAVNGKQADCMGVAFTGDFHGTRIEAEILGRSVTLASKLVGAYNVGNILAAACAVISQGVPVEALMEVLPEVPPVPGRLELVAEASIGVFVDYAHTPDALLNVLRSLRPLTSGRIITVFGCGGDRDRGKRPLMGQAVASLSDIAVVTSDNPRTEKPEQIISDITEGLAEASGFFYETVVQRDNAIERALELARPGDIVLVAGKGHEPYQEVMGVRHDFLDREVCLEAMQNRGLV